MKKLTKILLSIPAIIFIASFIIQISELNTLKSISKIVQLNELSGRILSLSALAYVMYSAVLVSRKLWIQKQIKKNIRIALIYFLWAFYPIGILVILWIVLPNNYKSEKTNKLPTGPTSESLA